VTLPAQTCSVADSLESCDGCAGPPFLPDRQATALVAVRNHPSGDPTPSAADVALAVEIMAAGQLLDIVLLAHPIIGQGRLLSL
jgi:RadC-like JAB domain